MGRADLTFRSLTPDQVDALNACYRALHAQDIAERQADITRTSNELAAELTPRAIDTVRADVQAELSAPPFGVVFGGPPSAPEHAPSAVNTSQSVPPAPWETASAPTNVPPPPPPPPAPMPTSAPQVAAGTPRDKYNTPHNAELHAPLDGKTGGVQANGSWKRKRSASQEAYDAWRKQWEGVSSAPSAPPAPPAPDINAIYGAPPVTNGAAPLPPAHVFFGSASSEPDLDTAPPVDEPTFLSKAGSLARSGLMTQALATQIMKHPKINATDNVDVGRNPDKRRKAFLLLTMLEAGTWPKAA